MIRQTFHLPKYDWTVRVYYAVTSFYVDEIMDNLHRIGCRGKNLRKAHRSLLAGKLDSGITYSDYSSGRTVIVLDLTSSSKEFLKSLHHETGHLAEHIAEAFGIDPGGEEIQYLGDDIMEEMWPIARHFLCEDCREDVIRKGIWRKISRLKFA